MNMAIGNGLKVGRYLISMKNLAIAPLLLIICASFVCAANTTITASTIAATNQVQIDLGCSWDRDIRGVMAWGYYGIGDTKTMELMSPQVVANGRVIILVFIPADLVMGEKPLAHVRLEYQTTAPKC